MTRRADVVSWASWDELVAEYGGDGRGITRAELEGSIEARRSSAEAMAVADLARAQSRIAQPVCGHCRAAWSAECACRRVAARVTATPDVEGYATGLERFAAALRMYAPRGGAQVMTVQQCAELATGRSMEVEA